MSTRDPAKRGTETSSFGAGKRESHDATAFYARFSPPILDDDEELGPRPHPSQLGPQRQTPDDPETKGDWSPVTQIVVDVDDVAEYLGKTKVWHDEAKDRTDVPGVATGLAVTGAGGDVLFIEATAMEGEAGLILTGQLGDVMKESGRIALSYIESHSVDLEILAEALKRRFHLHVPAGAVPKDGPSAGVTMVTAIASLLTGRKVKSNLGMTGEVTLQGKVLPIGGVKQKVLAAHRAGLTEVILPLRNEADLDDVPESVRAVMTFYPVDSIDQVLEIALVR